MMPRCVATVHGSGASGCFAFHWISAAENEMEDWKLAGE